MLLTKMPMSSFSNKAQLASVALSFALVSCAAPPPNADYGEYPSGYENDAKQQIANVLKDPDSARFQFGAPVKAYGNNGLIYGGGVAFIGYILPIEVNARNSFGGYTGYEDWFCLYENGVVRNCQSGSYISNPLVHIVG